MNLMPPLSTAIGSTIKLEILYYLGLSPKMGCWSGLRGTGLKAQYCRQCFLKEEMMVGARRTSSRVSTTSERCSLSRERRERMRDIALPLQDLFTAKLHARLIGVLHQRVTEDRASCGARGMLL